MTLYDRIGHRYHEGRRTDPRWMAAIAEALGDARTVLNVGAGTGNYEPSGRAVVAIEPSSVMLAQRPQTAAPVVQATAEALPVRDGAFDAALAVLTLHHWTDVERGLAELRRVARRQVVLLFEPGGNADFWLVRDYLPSIVEVDRGWAVSTSALRDHLGPIDVRPLAVPRDMQDGVLAAHWARPEAYLDPHVRARASAFAKLDPSLVADAVDALRNDLADGTWARRNAELADLDALEAGYRLVVAGDGCSA